MSLGSAHQTITTGDKFLPEVWSKQLQIATQSNLVAGKLVKRFDSEVSSFGDTLHVPKISNLSATSKSASTQVTFNAPTEGSIDLLINAHYECSFLIEDRLDAQSKYNLAEEYKVKQSYALSKQIDTDILALQTNLTQSVGTSGTPPSDLNVLRAIQYLDDADAPYEDRAFIMKPSLKASLLAIDRYVSQDFVGMDLPVKNGLFGQRYGIPFFVSTNVPNDSNGNPINQLIHKEVYCCAIQKNVEMKNDYIIEYLSQAYVAQVLYGVLTYRATFGCTVLSN